MESCGNSALIKSEGNASATGKPWTFCFWLFIASVALNVLLVWLLRSHETINSLDYDEQEYWNDASGFLNSGFSGIMPRRTPPFPILIATLRSVLGSNYFPVQIALSALLAFSPVLVFWLVKRQLGTEFAAKLASIGFLIWPLFLRCDITLYSDSTALLVFLIYLLTFPLLGPSEDSGRWRWTQFCISGALLSLCMQIKPLYLIYIPFAVILAISRETIFKRRIYAASCLIAGCIAATLPWSIYISSREGHLILLSANDGETLAGGLNPALLRTSNGSYAAPDGRSTWSGPGKWLQMDATTYLSEREMKLPYADESALLRERAYVWIKSHPGAAIYLTWRKMLYMWGIYPFWNGTTQTLFGNAPLLLLICASLASVWINREALFELSLFWTLPLFSSAVCLVSWGSWRFRIPGDLGLIVLTAVLLIKWRTFLDILPRRPPPRSTSSTVSAL